MLYVIYFGIQVLNLIGTNLRKESKLISLLTLLFVWMIFAGNTSSPDTANYIIRYDSAELQSYGFLDFGYLFLNKIGNYMGLDYSQFRMISLIPCILLVHSTVKKYTNNYHYVYFFYLLYAIFIDSEQIRNFMSMSIIIFASRFLTKTDIINRTKYIVAVLVATSVHLSSIVYLLLLLINSNNANKSVKILVSISFLTCIITFANGNNIPFLGEVSQLMENDKISGYLNMQTKFGFLYPFCLHLFNFSIVLWSRKILNRSISKSISPLKNKECEPKVSSNAINMHISFVDIVFWINLIAFLFFPLYMLTITFDRLTRNLIILNLIACSLAQGQLKAYSLKRMLFNSVVLADIGAWFYYDVIIKDHLEDIIMPIFENNLFF